MINYNKLYEVGKNLNVLFVENDKDFLETSTEIFANIFHSITVAEDGQEGLEKYLSYFEKNNRYFDMVISDFHMPKMNGVDLSKAICELNPDQTIVIVSAFNQPEDLISFINIGINKFLLKPFEVESMVEVLYEASLPLSQKNSQEKEKAFIFFSDDIKWDIKNELLLNNDRSVNLPTKEYQFLKLLIKNNPSITSYEEIFSSLWNEEFNEPSLNTLKSIISRLRTKLPKNMIQNISKIGYRLEY